MRVSNSAQGQLAWEVTKVTLRLRLPWGSGPVQSVKFKFNFKLNLIMDVGVGAYFGTYIPT